MPEFLSNIAENYGAYLGVLAAFVLAFDRLAKLTPTTVDDKIAGTATSVLYKIFSVLGLKVEDNKGKEEK